VRVGVRDPVPGIRGCELVFTMKSYRELEVWQIAMELVESVYVLARTFPDREKFGLASQIQRSAVSIPANIAEGWGRKHRREYLHHLSIAYGSLMETETHIMIAVRLKYLSRDEAKETWQLCERTGQMLNKLQRSLEAISERTKAGVSHPQSLVTA